MWRPIRDAYHAGRNALGRYATLMPARKRFGIFRSGIRPAEGSRRGRGFGHFDDGTQSERIARVAHNLRTPAHISWRHVVCIAGRVRSTPMSITREVTRTPSISAAQAASRWWCCKNQRRARLRHRPPKGSSGWSLSLLAVPYRVVHVLASLRCAERCHQLWIESHPTKFDTERFESFFGPTDMERSFRLFGSHHDD